MMGWVEMCLYIKWLFVCTKSWSHYGFCEAEPRKKPAAFETGVDAQFIGIEA